MKLLDGAPSDSCGSSALGASDGTQNYRVEFPLGTSILDYLNGSIGVWCEAVVSSPLLCVDSIFHHITSLTRPHARHQFHFNRVQILVRLLYLQSFQIFLMLRMDRNWSVRPPESSSEILRLVHMMSVEL